MARAFNPNDILFTITCEPEDISPRTQIDDEGMVSHIEREMEHNKWAWCQIMVTASWGGFEGTQYLGACSYKDKADFKKDGYFLQMKNEATSTLKRSIRDAGWELEGNDPPESNLAALLTDMPRTLVGDGKTPNIFFVTNTETGNTIAVLVGDDMETAAIALADNRTEPLMVEDRLNGVVHDNPAGERLQDRLREEEENEG